MTNLSAAKIERSDDVLLCGDHHALPPGLLSVENCVLHLAYVLLMPNINNQLVTQATFYLNIKTYKHSKTQ